MLEVLKTIRLYQEHFGKSCSECFRLNTIMSIQKVWHGASMKDDYIQFMEANLWIWNGGRSLCIPVGTVKNKYCPRCMIDI
jgi:hypothetical protein